jgi:leucyl/phenylalanyl-tRNA---protein transferase
LTIGFYNLPTGTVAAIETGCDFPPLKDALSEPNGLLAIGGDLSVEMLLKAYYQGIFPWFSEGEPILWWGPNPRMVLYPTALKISRSLSKTLKKTRLTISFNTAFREVITACSQTNRAQQAGTWITQGIIEAYCRLHDAGYAISEETWDGSTLVGGCYGVLIDRMFFGESMFHHQTDASKIAFVHLVEYLRTINVGMIDCQMNTKHLASFGATEISRDAFAEMLNQLTQAKT